MLKGIKGKNVSFTTTIQKLAAGALATVAVLGVSGCTTVDVYSDSLLADSASWSYGENARSVINDQSAQITTRGWTAEPMRSMAGSRLPHSFAGRALATGANVIVISFGTNDASNFADGAGGYDANVARFYALDWMKRAKDAGAGCVVWVTGNPGAYSGRPWKTTFTNYLNDFNGWLASLGPNVLTGSGTIKLRLASFGNIAASGLSKDNGVHPNAAGASLLGLDIKNQINSCKG